MLDRAATAVALLGPGGDFVAFTRDIAAVRVPGVGLQTRQPSQIVAGVASVPQWVISEARELIDLSGPAPFGDWRSIGVIGSQLTPFNPPFSSAAAVSRTGRRAVIVTAASSLFAAEVNSATAIDVPATIPLRLVSPSPIVSVAFPLDAPADSYLAGYAVTANGLLKLSADTATHWTFAPIPLPTALTPVSVWFTGNRGRVGFSNGSVYSLPSRVEIAAALPDDVAVDFTQACGQQFLLASHGLFRLEPVPGKAAGQWRPVSLPIGGSPNAFEGGRIHGLRSDLYVFRHNGETAWLTFSPCP